MRPQTQSIGSHNAAEGQQGDCHRTCLAMILDLDRDEVPHFMDGMSNDLPWDAPECLKAEAEERAWLDNFNLTPVYIAYDGSTGLDQLMTVLGVTCRDAAVILGCTSSNGDNHSVVYYQGKLYNPNMNTVAGPMRDGMWWVTIYARTTKPLPLPAGPPTVVIQENDSGA